VAWSKDDPFGAEFAVVEFSGDRLDATGVAIGAVPVPYRLDYALHTGARFVTTHLVVATAGDGWSRRLALRRSGAGGWAADVEQRGTAEMPDAGGDSGPLTDALDPDLGLSPLFNSMPVLRHELHLGGASDDFLMVWISVPDLALVPSPQRYTHIETRGREHVVRFEAVGEGDDFIADIVFDQDGLVVDYPGVAARLPGGG
jgi:hypothetical protein